MPTVVRGDFEWDDSKARTNRAKHGVAFEEAALAFADPRLVFVSDGGDRLVAIGFSHRGRLLCVAHVDRGSRHRIISARVATSEESKLYVEG